MHFAIGDIVQRADIKGRKRFVITGIDGYGWIYARPLGGGGRDIVTFPSQYMLKKVS